MDEIKGHSILGQHTLNNQGHGCLYQASKMILQVHTNRSIMVAFFREKGILNTVNFRNSNILNRGNFRNGGDFTADQFSDARHSLGHL